MPGIAFCSAELVIELTDRDVWVAAAIIPDPFEFLFGVCV